jgi:hypothetical protein
VRFRLSVLQRLPFTFAKRLLDDGLQLTSDIFDDFSLLLRQLGLLFAELALLLAEFTLLRAEVKLLPEHLCPEFADGGLYLSQVRLNLL